MRFEALSRRHPWIAAAVVAVAVPVAVSAWLLLGLSYRLWSRAPF